MKKRYIIVSVCILVLCTVSIGVYFAVHSQHKQEKQLTEFEAYMANKSGTNQQDRDDRYNEYLSEHIRADITELEGVSDCSTQIQGESGTISLVTVKLSKNKDSGDVEEQIKSLISKSLDVDPDIISIMLQ